MIIQLQPEQLVEVWPGIREGIESVGRIVTDNTKFSPNVLAALLGGRFQCWLILNTEREIHAFVITSLGDDPLTGEKYLNLEVVYGFRHLSDELIFDAWDKLKNFASEYKCDYIRATTSVARAEEILLLVGAQEISKNFVARIKE